MTVTRSGGDRSGRHGDLARVDGPVVVRAASAAFTILLLGGLAAPLIAALIPPVVGRYWLIVVAIGAFVAAGTRIGTAASPTMHGAIAAASGYLMVVPVVAMTGGLRAEQFVTTFATAIVLGGAAGYVRGRFRGREGTPPGGGRAASVGGGR